MENISQRLNRMTLAQKVGQLICPVIRIDDLAEEQIPGLLEELACFQYGGYILFGGAAKTRALIQQLQETAEIPLFIASDIECGTGSQINGATCFPDNMAISATGSVENAYLKGKYTALEARAVGINWAYAPVVDVNNNPANPIINVRSFGESPELVGRMGAAFIRGCQDWGVLATAKHFPGHGDTDMDSHSALPVIPASRERLEQVEIPPFAAAIKAGVASIMTAHIAVPALDPQHPNLPATLSEAMMTGLLRDQMGFEGLIVTDALIMEGIMGFGSPEETALQSVLAGCDIVLVPPDPVALSHFLQQAVQEGRLSLERLEQSLLRILQAKSRFQLWQQRQEPENPALIGHPDHSEVSMQMFHESLTLIRDQQGLLPLDPAVPVLSLIVNDMGSSGVADVWNAVLKENCPSLHTLELSWDSPDSVFGELAGIPTPVTVLVAIFSQIKPWNARLNLDPRVPALLNGSLSQHPACIVVSFGNPYLLKDFPGIGTYACAYMPYPYASHCMARAVLGQLPFKGRLPVSIPGVEIP